MPLDPEDEKLITLARAARARNGAAEGAAVRDSTGRTYVATAVALRSLRLSALQTAIAIAITGGSVGFEAAALVGPANGFDPADLAVLREAGGTAARLVLADPAGLLRHVDTVQ